MFKSPLCEQQRQTTAILRSLKKKNSSRYNCKVFRGSHHQHSIVASQTFRESRIGKAFGWTSSGLNRKRLFFFLPQSEFPLQLGCHLCNVSFRFTQSKATLSYNMLTLLLSNKLLLLCRY